ncbi:MAG: hypothetical protein DMG70_09485 [Acidobacteria bacterium]|nr:MAG: hypothetical protein DMG70_09485 [Acidobacteriota bacterium]
MPLKSHPRPFVDSKLPNGAPRLATLGSELQPAASPGRLWRHRLLMLAFVFFCAALGVVLVVFPWRDEWAHNRLMVGYPTLQKLMASGFVRGVSSGLGLVDIWIGFWEAVHYRE